MALRIFDAATGVHSITSAISKEYLSDVNFGKYANNRDLLYLINGNVVFNLKTTTNTDAFRPTFIVMK